jgi:hypothetical protein
VALHLASAKRTPPPRKSEAHLTAACVQVPRIGICGAGRCVFRVTCRICSTSSLRGDLISAILALLALATLRTRSGTVVTWVFNTFGTADLFFAFYQGSRISLPATQGLSGAGYFILTAYVSLLLITHGLAFRILLETKVAVPSRNKLSPA